MQFLGEHVNLPGQLGVGLELQFLGLEVMVGFGLLKSCLTVLAIITKVDKKIASSETTKVKVGRSERTLAAVVSARIGFGYDRHGRKAGS